MTEPMPRPTDQQILLGLRQAISEQHLGVRAIHLHRAGRTDIEHRFVEDTAENVYSVSKTVTALGLGIAIGEGLLSVDDLLVDHLPPPERLGRGVDQITVRHLLTMTSGSPVTAFAIDERLSRELGTKFLSTDLTSTPGERFEYSNGSSYMVARLVEQVTGQRLRDWLVPRLFEPMGIINPQWFTCRAGHTWGATGLVLITSDMAKFGRLMLQGGRWDDQQLVPPDWIEAMHSNWVATGDQTEPEATHYGFGV